MVRVNSKTVKHSDSDLIKSGLQVVTSTKLNKPSIPANCITRTSLLEQLEKNWQLPLTLVSAATGCGKSITVSQWLDKSNHKYGWLSLDKEHNDTQVLLAYLLAIFKKVWPGKTFGLEYLLDGIELPQNVIVNTLINDIDQLSDNFVLVLDDYHLISEEKIHMIFNGILLHPPENLHLVILTQMDPPLKLATLRAKFQLNELRMRDLAFTAEEALELRSLIARATSNDEVNTLLKLSEGWATGITVGLMGLSTGIEFEKVLNALHSRNSIIAELLDEAVLKRLPIQTQKYLQISSLVDQFSVDLIEAMIASINDKDLTQISIEELIISSRKKNLFLIPLDGVGEWFRYHHLFQSQIKKLAEKNFSNDEISLMYKAASSYYEKNGTLEEALQYAIKSKDLAYAVGLFSRFYHELFNTEQQNRIYRLINQFPEEACNNHLELLIVLAMLQDHKVNYSGMQQYLARAEEIFNEISVWDDHEKQLFGEFHSVSTILYYIFGDLENSIKHGEKCMELLPPGIPNFFREFAIGWYALAQQTSGNASIGLEKLKSELKTYANTDQYFNRRFLQGRCLISLMEGELPNLEIDGATLISICTPKKNIHAQTVGIYSLISYLYQTNQFKEIFRYHADIWLYRYVSMAPWVLQLLFTECLASIALGIKEKVDLYLNQIDEFAGELALEMLTEMVKAFKVELFLRLNDIERAVELAPTTNFEPYPPIFFYYIPQLTQVKLLCQTNQKEKGKELLQNLVDMGRMRHNRNLLIQALALQAVLYANDSHHQLAKKVIAEVLQLSKDTQNIRVFLDQGDGMYHLLREIAEDQPENNQVKEILQAIEDDKHSLLKSESKLTGTRKKYVDSLSNRELEILLLVNQGLKNDAIADQLFISNVTVKKHLYRAYQKLGVNNRTGAIIKMKALGLLTSQ